MYSAKTFEILHIYYKFVDLILKTDLFEKKVSYGAIIIIILYIIIIIFEGAFPHVSRQFRNSFNDIF